MFEALIASGGFRVSQGTCNGWAAVNGITHPLLRDGGAQSIQATLGPTASTRSRAKASSPVQKATISASESPVESAAPSRSEGMTSSSNALGLPVKTLKPAA